jgi:hypothetical protein
MNAEQPKHEELPGAKGYERVDASAGSTIRAGIYVLGTMLLVAALVVPLYWFYARRETEAQPRAATVLKSVPSPGVFPKLVVNEPRTLAEFREREDALLETYGWVEKDRGIVRMPVAEALRLVGERRALPVFASSPAGGAARSGGTR